MARNQYPRAAILQPPGHTVIELQRVLELVAPVRGQGPIVDFGSGTGRLSVALAQAGHSVLAVDVSPRSLASLRELAGELGLHIETTEALPAGGRFPAVVGADVLHHVDMRLYLPKIHAVLAEGGKAIFSEPGAANPLWYVYLPLLHDMRIERRIVTCNIRTLRRALGRHGFRDVRVTGLGLLPRPLFSRSPALCRSHDAVGDWPVLRWFAYRYIVEATK